MLSQLDNTDAVLGQDLACRIVRVLLASPVALPSEAITLRLVVGGGKLEERGGAGQAVTTVVTPEEVVDVIESLHHRQLVDRSEGGYLISTTGRASRKLWQAVEDYEARLLKDRAKRMTVDVRARFELTEVLRAGIARAREDAASQRLKAKLDE